MKRDMVELNSIPQDDFEIDDILNSINGLFQTEDSSQEDDSNDDTPAESTRKKLEKMGFVESQIQEVLLGIDQQLPVEIYSKDCYNWKQMREIRLGLLDRLDTTYYEDSLFSAEQMHEIRLGLIDHLDVAQYAKLLYTTTDMSRLRRKLLAEIYQENPSGFGKEIVDEESRLRIRISDDALEAYVTIPESFEHSAFDIKRILTKNGVVHGILLEPLKDAVQNKTFDQEILAAKGEAAAKGKDAHFEYFFNKLLPESPQIHENGSVDYTEVVVAEKVKKGKLLAKYHSGFQGDSGETVTGIPLTGQGGRELPPFTGTGFSWNAQENTYTAATDGFVVLDEDQHSLNVWNVFIVDGDVNRYNGNITYDGSVHIKGSVSDMANITASGNIVIDGFVEGAEIKAGGNIIIGGGVNADGIGHIHAGGKVMGNFFEFANIDARGRVEGNYFLNCSAKTDNMLIARGNKARIMGGEIKAASAVESVIIGNYGGKSTVIDVGNLSWIEKRMNKYQKSLNKVIEEAKQLEEGKEKLENLLGEDISENNALYQKTCLALEIKNEQRRALEWEVEYFTTVRRNARRAYVKASGGIQEGVTIVLNGAKQKLQKTVRLISLNQHGLKPKRRNG